MSYNIEDLVKLNHLFDIYQPLLTDKQKEYFQYYYVEDYSLSEIADIMDVSRNAVHLQIKKITAFLEKYENKLKIFEGQKQRNMLIDELLNNHQVSKTIKDKLNDIKKV
mgnify:CR=1 FL=1